MTISLISEFFFIGGSFEKELKLICAKKFEDFVKKVEMKEWNLKYTQFPIDKHRYSFS